MRKRSCKAADPKDSRNIRSISGYLVITRTIGNEVMDDKCMYLSIGIYRWHGFATAKGTRVSGKHRRVSSKFSGAAGDHLDLRGSPGESSYENLESDLVKSFNLNRREIRVPEYRRGVKDPNTTQWRRGPMGRTAMLVKSFAMSRLNFGQGVWKGIPTGSQL